jgi:hypothetical protein
VPVKLSLTSLLDLIAAGVEVEVLEAGAVLVEEGAALAEEGAAAALAAEEAVVEEDLEVELLGAGVGADLGAAGRIKSSSMLIFRRCRHLFLHRATGCSGVCRAIIAAAGAVAQPVVAAFHLALNLFCVPRNIAGDCYIMQPLYMLRLCEIKQF